MASIPDLLKNLETGIEGVKRRPFDRYALGPFMIWYGLKSKNMGKWPRRAMVAGGLFQLLYAWREYRQLIGAVQESPTAVLEVIKNDNQNEVTT
jgi:hypothetical protein